MGVQEVWVCLPHVLEHFLRCPKDSGCDPNWVAIPPADDLQRLRRHVPSSEKGGC